MIDFDLEAPGLEQYFQINQAAARRSFGLLDLLLAYKRSMSVVSQSAFDIDFREIDRFIVPVYEQLPGGGRLDLLPAGQRETREQLDAYASSLRTFDWQDFYYNWEGELFFEWMRGRLVPDRYDLVLVDSRTGVTEMGGICTYQLADVIVMLSAANHQNREGTRNVAADFESAALQMLRHQRPLQIVVVPARVEQRDAELLRAFSESFTVEFSAYLPPVLRDAGLGFMELTIPYEPHYAFEERVISDPTHADTRRDIAGAFERLATAIALLAAPASAVAQRAAPGPSPASPGAAPARPQFDATKRFAGYEFFISYHARDGEPVERLTRELAGAELFLDRYELAAAADWRKRAETALFHSGAFILCIGAGGPSADHVLQVTAALATVTTSRDVPTIVALLPGAADSHAGGLAGPLQAAHVVDFRGGFEDARRTLVRASIRLTAPAATEAAAPTSDPGAPYRGPRPFTERDASLFTGRETAAAEIVQAIDDRGLAIVSGPSGCGKTSLVLAGVVPALRRREATSPASGWLVERCSARQQAEADLRRAIDSLRAASEQAAAPRQMLLFADDVDQLLRQADPAAREAWLRRLLAAHGGDRPMHVIVSVREDYAAELADLLARIAGGPPPTIAIPTLTLAEIRRITEFAAERVGLAFEPGLVQRIVDDWNDQRFLRLLQTVLEQLWMQRREGFLTNRAYEAIPDPVESMAETAFAALPERLQPIVERVVPRLIWLCGDLDLDRRCAREELLLDGITPGDLDAALEQLIAAGLVYATAGADGRRCVAPSFTSVQWSRAETWVDNDREFLQWLGNIDAYRRTWQHKKRAMSELLGGSLLAEGRHWLRERHGALTASERDYVTASLARRRQVTGIVAAAVAAILIAVGVSAYSSWTAREAERLAAARDRLVGRAVEMGTSMVAGGNVVGALALYSEGLASYPENATLRFRRGSLFFQQNDFDRAIADLTSAIDNGSERNGRGDAYAARALAYFRKGETARALADVDQAIRLKPNDPQPLYTRGVIREQLEQRDAALTDYHAALRMKPDFVDALFSRATLYVRRDQTNEAITDFKLVAVLPNATSAQREAAQARLETLGQTATVARVEPRLFVHVARGEDLDAGRKVAAALKERKFDVQSVAVATQPTNGDVRFFFKEDENAAVEIRSLVEGALARQGYALQLQPLLRPRAPGVNSGTIEIWLPSLALRLPSKAS